MIASLLMLAAQAAPWDCGGDDHAAAARAAVEAGNAAAVAALGSGDLSAYAGHFAEDAVQYPPNAPAYEGRDAIAEGWQAAAGMGQWDLSLETLALDVCGPVAIERGAYTLGFEPVDGAPIPAFTDEGHYLVHWRLEGDGEWRIAADAPVSTQAPMAP